MAFHLTYRPLFEVRIIHEYLIDDLNLYWLQSDAEERNNYLLKLGYTLRDTLRVHPHPETQKHLLNQRMHFAELPTGFNVLVEVMEEVSGSNVYYRPNIPIPEGLSLHFRATPANPYFRSQSGICLQPQLEDVFVLDNRVGTLIYPSLAGPLPLYNPFRTYEMGELVRNTSGNSYLAEKHTAAAPGTADWYSLVNRNYLNSETPVKMLSRSTYRLRPTAAALPLVNVRAVLTDATGPIAEQYFGNLGNDRQLALDFRDVVPEVYMLEIYNGSTLLDRRKVYLSQDRSYQPDGLVIQIGHEAGLGDFRLLEPPGTYLRMDAGQVSPPVFEIRITSRLTRWKYIPFDNQTLVPDNTSDVEPDSLSPNALVAIEPHKLSQFFRTIQFRPNAASQYHKLPNPAQPYIHELGEEQYYSVIHLPELNL